MKKEWSIKMYDFFSEIKIVRLSKAKLTIDEERLIDCIGRKNFDYCLTAILQKRNPNDKIEYNESEEKLYINDWHIEVDRAQRIANEVKKILDDDNIDPLSEVINWINELIKIRNKKT